FSVAQPTDAGGQALVLEALDPVLEPAAQARVVTEHLQHGRVGAGDVPRVARQRYPPEGTAALAELLPDEGRHETGVAESLGVTALAGEGPQVVAVVERHRARLAEFDDGPAVLDHGRQDALPVPD